MPRKPILCAGPCGRRILPGKGSLPEGQATCRECRRFKPRPYGRRPGAGQRPSADDEPGTLTCVQCGREFPFALNAGRVPRKTCSEECRKVHLSERMRTQQPGARERACRDCGGRFVGPHNARCENCRETHKRTRWAHFNGLRHAREAAERAARRPTRHCLKCSGEIADPRRTRYCSKECARSAPNHPLPSLCPECGGPTGVRRKYCTPEHARAARRRRDLARAGTTPEDVDTCKRCHGPKAARPGSRAGRLYCEICRPIVEREAVRRAKQRRKARERQVDHEDYTLEEIAARDRYKCGICRRKVHMHLAVPHKSAPTIDHVLPLADGGHDVRANVRLAHFICNSLRGNRGGPVQLALVG